MREEIGVLQRVGAEAMHGAIANLIEVVESRAAIHVILQYCSGGSLRRALEALPQGMPEPQALRLAGQLAGGLAHLASLGVA
eukprot:5120874-Prymnesium_polylepis.1